MPVLSKKKMIMLRKKTNLFLIAKKMRGNSLD